MTAVDFELPKELEAGEPAEMRGSGRDDVKLLVTDGDTVTHAHFRELPRFLEPGDLLVLNTTATLPAALSAIRDDGDVIALHVSTPLPGGLVVVEPRKTAVHEGEHLSLPGDAEVVLLAPYRDSKRLWIARFTLAQSLREYLQQFGRPITYSYVDRRFPLDAYQTVYASEPGSAEMPSAGRAFTRQ